MVEQSPNILAGEEKNTTTTTLCHEAVLMDDSD